MTTEVATEPRTEAARMWLAVQGFSATQREQFRQLFVVVEREASEPIDVARLARAFWNVNYPHRELEGIPPSRTADMERHAAAIVRAYAALERLEPV